ELDVFEGLTLLVEKNLVREAAASFSMLETIREFALEQLLEVGEEDEQRRRHAGWYTDLAEQKAPDMTGPDQIRALAELDATRGNMRAALQWAIASDPELGLRLATALGWYWYVRGHLAEGQASLEQATAAAG